jgi:hypothetical protein
MLVDRRNLDEALEVLRGRAEAGNGDAQQIATLLIQKGHGEEARRLRRFGLNLDGSIANA